MFSGVEHKVLRSRASITKTFLASGPPLDHVCQIKSFKTWRKLCHILAEAVDSVLGSHYGSRGGDLCVAASSCSYKSS